MRKQLLPFILTASFSVLVSGQNQAQTFTTLHSFTFNLDGARPAAGLILLGDMLYGTAEVGGTNDSGTVFALTAEGINFTNLHTFSAHTGLIENYYNDDGTLPEAGLILSGDTLYGTTGSGGTNGNGTVFTVKTTGAGFANLHFFAGDDGSWPQAGLVLSGNTLYGATSSGGTNGSGTLFAINTDGTGFTNLHAFSGVHYNGAVNTNNDGASPWGDLILSDSVLYGTTVGGGTNGAGTIFAITTNGTAFTVLHTFTRNDGAGPRAPLLLWGNTLYGTTVYGGTNDNGTLFAVHADGTGFTNLYKFNGNDGANPWAGLTLAGNLLCGTTVYGGTNGNGTIFSIYRDGTGFMNLHSFAVLSAPPASYGTNSDGANPYAGLVLSGDTLYGTAEWGGTGAFGTIFSLTLPLPPQLFISVSGTNVLLTWTTNVTGYTLQSTTNLVPPVLWNTVSPSPIIVAGQNTVTNPLSGTQMFYRLSQ